MKMTTMMTTMTTCPRADPKQADSRPPLWGVCLGDEDGVFFLFVSPFAPSFILECRVEDQPKSRHWVEDSINFSG